MNIRDIAQKINGRVVCCEENIPVLSTEKDTFTNSGQLYNLIKKE